MYMYLTSLSNLKNSLALYFINITSTLNSPSGKQYGQLNK